MMTMPARRSNLLAYFLVGLWAITLIFLVQDGFHQRIFTTAKSFNSLGGSTSDKPTPISGISDKDRLLLQGDPSAEPGGNIWTALHKSDPDNPAYYQMHLSEVAEVPPNFKEVVQRLDPENGWFLVWEAGWLTKKSISKHRSSPKKKADPPRRRFIIDDADQLSKNIELLEKGLTLPKFDPYTRAVTSERFAALPQAKDTLANYRNIAIIASQPTPVLAYKHACDAISAALQESADVSDFERLENIALLLEQKHFDHISCMVDALVNSAVINANSQALHHAALRLGLKDKAAFYKRRATQIKDRKERLANRSSSESEELISKHGSIITSLAFPTVLRIAENPPLLTQEDLLPGARAERALISRALFSLGFIILSILSLILFFHRRDKENPATFSPNSRILVLGSLLPFLLILVFRYLLSFGSLDFGGHLLIFANYYLPDFASLFVLLITPLCLLRREASPESSFLKIWWPLGLALTALMTSISMMWSPQLLYPTSHLLIGTTLLGLLIFSSGKAFKRKPEPDYFSHLARLGPIYLLSASLFGLFALGLKFEERFWFAKAKIEQPGELGFTLYESQTTEALKKEIAELAGFEQ